jgi:hypothetical protein
VVDSTSVFEEPVAPIFSAEDEGTGFLQDVDTRVPKFINKGTLLFFVSFLYD